jgi:hypothetical protein
LESPVTRETVGPALLDALLLAMRRSPARPLAAAGA